MRSTRSSARLAKPTKPTPATNDEVSAQDSDFDEPKSEGDGFKEEEETPAPKRKRQRKAQAAKPATRKKGVRGKQGRLEGLMKMPIDIFTEIALYLLPGDIIVLSRSNKFMRNLLMHRSALHIWHGAMRNVEGLPPCPPDMSEPHYLALIYSRHCSMCGGTATRRMDEVLRVRLCPTCRTQSLVSIHQVPFEIWDCVLHSRKIVPNKGHRGSEPHVLKRDFEDVTARLPQLKASGSPAALEQWQQTRRKEIEVRRQQAEALTLFLDKLENNRDNELSGLRIERRIEIERRLREIGWEDKDFQFPYTTIRQWHSLVSQPKAITDRTWENLRPKLIPLLEANHAARLEKEKLARKRARKECLDQLMAEIKATRAPIIEATIRSPSILPASSTDEPSTTVAKHVGVFPDIADAIEWPVVNELQETDVPIPEMEAQFAIHRAEIDTEINDWIVRVETHMAELLRKGRVSDNLSPQAADPILPTETETTANPFNNVSADLKLLLRADSLFESSKPPSAALPPLAYDALIASGYDYAFNPLQLMRSVRKPLDLTKFKRHAAAQASARVLLEDLGKPNATHLEMRGAGQRYTCGRCHDETAKTWEEMVFHYLNQNAVWEKRRAYMPGLTFNNVHDLAFATDKPIISLMTTTEVVAEASGALDGGLSKMCKLCQQIGLFAVRCRQEKMIAHLVDVHGVSEPKEAVHYSTASYGFMDIFDFGHEDPFMHSDSDSMELDPYGIFDDEDDFYYGW